MPRAFEKSSEVAARRDRAEWLPASCFPARKKTGGWIRCAGHLPGGYQTMSGRSFDVLGCNCGRCRSTPRGLPFLRGGKYGARVTEVGMFLANGRFITLAGEAGCAQEKSLKDVDQKGTPLVDTNGSKSTANVSGPGVGRGAATKAAVDRS